MNESDKAILDGMTVPELRGEARRREWSNGTSWIASATKAQLIEALSSGQAPDDKPTTIVVGDDNKAATLVALLQSLGCDEAKVRQIVGDEVKARAAEHLSKDAVMDMIREVLAVQPVIRVERRGEVKEVKGQHRLFPKVMGALARGESLYIAGPTGSGKTTMVKRAGEELGLKVFVQVACTMPYDIVGFRDANGNIVDTEVTRWARYEGDALLILDEVDSFFPAAALAANTALANGFMVCPDGQVEIRKNGARKMVVATANTWGLGGNGDYCGRNRLDAAFLNRFSRRLMCDYDTVLEEGLAWAVFNGMVETEEKLPTAVLQERKDRLEQTIVKVRQARKFTFDNGLKGVVLSPRQVMTAAGALACGESVEDQWGEVLLGGADPTVARKVADAVNVTLPVGC